MKPAEYPKLSRLMENEELWEHVKDFDALRGNFDSRLPSEEDSSETAQITVGLINLAYEHFYSTLVFRFRTRELARGIFEAEKKRNLMVLFNLARAFMEHTASLAFQNQALEKAVADIERKQDFAQIQQSICKHRGIIARLYYGGNGSPTDAKRFHVNDFLNALAAIDERAPEHYEALCEFVHPNYKSNLLVSDGVLSAGSIGIPSETMTKELSLVRNVIESCAALDWDMVISGTRHLSMIENWATLINVKGAKLSQVFSVRAAHTGDGKSKDTAIFFKRARTPVEAIQAFHKYLEQEKITSHGRRIEDVDSGYLFEIVSTDKGPLWVKYRMTE